MPPKFVNKILHKLIQRSRILLYKGLSTCKNVSGQPKRHQPVILHGKGSISFGEQIEFGVKTSPGFYDGSVYIEARKADSKIVFGNSVKVNNNCSFISEGPGIEIGDLTLIGWNTTIVDSDFHDLNPKGRHAGGEAKTAKVTIGRNVLIGANVAILKGVSIGDNSTVAGNAVVTKSLPANGIYGGNPAKLIREI